jgi:aspartyl-tRNA(Asn)/glutamyl-tRNA(Gln) amidotransferase subunit A
MLGNGDDPGYCSLAELSRRMARGELSSRMVVETCLARIDALDGRLHSFVEVYSEAALACADAADLERRAGFSRGPLHGLPIALKDLLHIEGRVTTAGSRTWQARVANETATAVRRVVAAGMIPLGKTHMVEFARGGWGLNEWMGAPWNPWDPRTQRVAGGSSSGSAVAVAAGLAPAAIGSDTGGSIRIPAAVCGVTGLKPTYGRVSLAGVVPLAPTLDSIGPMTRTAEDAALLLTAMAGPDSRDTATLASPPLDIPQILADAPDIRGTRVTALSMEHLPHEIARDVARARSEALEVLGSLGAIVEEATAPYSFADLIEASGHIIAAEGYPMHRAYIEDLNLPIDPGVRSRTLQGKSMSAADYIDAVATRKREAAKFAEWMRKREALLTPTVPITATPLAQVDDATSPLAVFTRAANYLGACAISLPAGLSADGLPIGIELMAAPFAEATLIRLGRAFQSATAWHLRRPSLAGFQQRAGG